MNKNTENINTKSSEYSVIKKKLRKKPYEASKK